MSSTMLGAVRERQDVEVEGSLQMVSFQLFDEEYGIEIGKVREIILVGEITQVPETPDYVKGLINLRSMVIPVIDLKLRFGFQETEPTDATRIVVVNVDGKTVGIIVDSVNEVLRVDRRKMSAPPPTVAGLGQDYLVGLAKLEDRLLIVLDIERILRPEEDEHDVVSSVRVSQG